MRIPAGAAIAASALAVTVLASGGQADAAAHRPGWRIVATVGATSHNERPEALTATGQKDAFSAWTCNSCSTSNRNLDFVLHWDGRHWRSIGLPRPLTYPRFVTSLSASSASNLWAVNDLGKVGIWNGRRWTVKVLPAWVLRATREGNPYGQAAVLAPGNAWVFSVGAVSEPTLAAHFVRGAWRKAWLPVAPWAVSQVSSRDLWVLGQTRKSLRTSKPVTAVAHWNGSAWHALALPKVRVPSGTDAGYSLAAVASRDIWLTRQVAASGHTVSTALLHWTGRWHVIKVPFSTDSLQLGSLSQDGRGGVWMLVFRDLPSFHQYLYHYGSGHWARQLVPARAGVPVSVTTLAWIPGTGSLWAIGGLSKISGNTGVILKAGP
jgi:hypothetical protein